MQRRSCSLLHAELPASKHVTEVLEAHLETHHACCSGCDFRNGSAACSKGLTVSQVALQGCSFEAADNHLRIVAVPQSAPSRLHLLCSKQHQDHCNVASETV